MVEQRKVLDLIGRLREEQVPVILISHTLPDIFAVTNRIVVMHRGRKVAEKRTNETNSREIVRYIVGELDDTREARWIASASAAVLRAKNGYNWPRPAE